MGGWRRRFRETLPGELGESAVDDMMMVMRAYDDFGTV